MSNEAQNVLVVGPAVGRVTDELCTRLLTGFPVETVVGVTVVQSPSDRQRRWLDHDDLDGVRTAFVDVQSTTRAASADTPSVTDPGPASIVEVADPANLAALGRAIGDQLDAAEKPVALCFHSVTELLDYVETERALELLHTLAREVEAADATAHYHLDVDAHDEEAVELFGTVVDRVIELSRDGSDVSIR